MHDYGAGYPLHDFTMPYLLDGMDWFDAIVTNPPFRLALDFAERCLDIAPERGFALLCRAAWSESKKRYERLFQDRPPSLIAQFVERVPMVEGRCDPGADTATAYAWYCWRPGDHDTRYRWIPPCRKALEAPEDYA